MTRTFQERWKEYVSLFWQRVYCRIDTTNIFEKESIIAWGWIGYNEYEKSNLFINNKIIVNNKDLKVYYYVRILPSGYMKFFVFVNTTDFKELVMNLIELDSDYLFLKRLYESNLSIHSIFDHTYSMDCWRSLN